MNNIQPILKQLREAEKVATKTEWHDGKMGLICAHGGKTIISANKMSDADSALIVLMRNNLIPLLDYVEALQNENHFLRVTNGMPLKPLNITSADSAL